MRFRTWPVAALGLGGLLLLVVVSVLAASSRAQEIYTQLDQLNTYQRDVETRLRTLRSDVQSSGIFIRDYLLDPERENAPIYREALAKFRQDNVATVDDLRVLSSGRGIDERISRLETKLDDYWQAFDPLFDWTLVEKISQSASFLRREVLPRREAVLAIASEIEELNNANHAIQRAEVTRRHAEFRSELFRLVWGSLALGLFVALTAVIRLRVLERRSEKERAVAEEAEQLMRQLSQQLVAAQEEERKNLSRELHDHVGQMLTALRMEIGRIDRLRLSGDRVRPDASLETSPRSGIGGAVAECRKLVDDMVRTVRDLALGLRPSMLDDFGPRSNGTCGTSGAVSASRSSCRLTVTSSSCPSSTAPASTGQCRRRSPTACAIPALPASTCRSSGRVMVSPSRWLMMVSGSIRRSGGAVSVCAASRSGCAICTAF